VRGYVTRPARLPAAFKLQAALENQGMQNQQTNPLQDLIDAILGVFPAVLAPLKEEMDPAKVVRDPAPYIKPQTASHFQHSAWDEQDIVNKFAAKYGIDASQTSAKAATTKLYQMLDELDEMSLLDDLEEYLPDRVINDVVGISESDPLLAAEIFMAEAATQAFSEMKTTMDPSKVNKDPKGYAKPVKLSDLKKVLRKDPDYFNH
jgi:hypothetical protein